MKKGRDPALAVGLFALLFSVYLLTFSGAYHASDEMSMLAVTDSLARRGAWDIELLRWMGEEQGSFGPDGHLYGRKGIGTTLAALPHYWLALQSPHLGNVQTAMLTNSLVTALTGALVYLILRRLGYGQGVSLGTALAFGLASMAWPYAHFFFSESLAGLGLLASTYFLVCFGTGLVGDKGDDPSELQGSSSLVVYPLLAGIGLAVALLARLNNAIVAPLLGLLLLYYLNRLEGMKWRRWIGPIVLFALPVLAALGMAAAYNWLRFDDLLVTGYLPEERFSAPFLEGLYGLTLSPGKGLIWYNPLLLAALIAWPSFYRRHRAEALLCGSVVLANISFYASWFLWWAGHGWGPRFLVTILPFAVLPLVEAFVAAARRRWVAISLGALILISVAIQVLGVVVDFDLYLDDVHAELGLYHPDTLFDPTLSPLLNQAAYVSLENLDLAWAKGGAIDWLALSIGVGLVVVSGLALWAAWRDRLQVWPRIGLLALLGLGTTLSLYRYAPDGDVAVAAQGLVAMERPGEAAALTDSLLTEPFQNSYDGQLWVWGVRAKEEIGVVSDGTWVVGPGDPDPAAARIQVGAVRLDYYPSSVSPQGSQFDSARLPVPPLPEPVGLSDTVELVAAQIDGNTVRPGETLPLALFWRALAPMDISFTVFVQLIDKDGTKAGQIDSLPCGDGCPTTTWRPGDIVGELYALPTNTSAPPGQYQLIAGLYDLTTGERLVWLDAQGNAARDHLLIGTVSVQP